jgi:hypothetical protein
MKAFGAEIVRLDVAEDEVSCPGGSRRRGEARDQGSIDLREQQEAGVEPAPRM